MPLQAAGEAVVTRQEKALLLPELEHVRDAGHAIGGQDLVCRRLERHRQQKRLFLTRHYGLTRGWRMGPSNPSGDWIIVVLPYGTSAATAASVAEAMRRYKAGGVRVVVEVRGVP
jgi:hypothetical protein